MISWHHFLVDFWLNIAYFYREIIHRKCSQRNFLNISPIKSYKQNSMSWPMGNFPPYPLRVNKWLTKILILTCPLSHSVMFVPITIPPCSLDGGVDPARIAHTTIQYTSMTPCSTPCLNDILQTLIDVRSLQRINTEINKCDNVWTTNWVQVPRVRVTSDTMRIITSKITHAYTLANKTSHQKNTPHVLVFDACVKSHALLSTRIPTSKRMIYIYVFWCDSK